jgi:hypothetical protein
MKDLRFDTKEFEARLRKCGDDLKKIVAYLRNTAQHVGPDVSPRPYVPKTGWGITYYRGDQWFCQFHPKNQTNHVQALIHGATPAALEAAGFAPAHREDDQPWVPVQSMRDAVRLVPFILDAAGPDLSRRGASS